MAIEDWIDGCIDGHDYPDDEVICGICEEEGLHWENRGRGFRLYDEDGELHLCNPPTADDFEDVS